MQKMPVCVLTDAYTPPPPPSPVTQRPRPARLSNGPSPTMADAIVKRVLGTCKRVDSDVKLVNMTRDGSGHTHLRVRAGDVHSVESLRRALQEAMPLSQCTVAESWIDGTLEAEVTVFTPDEEHARARRTLVRSRWVSYPLLLALCLILIGLGEWMAAVRAAWATEWKKDEL